MSTPKLHKRSERVEDPILCKAVVKRCLAPMHDSIVDAVLKIMDEDGPIPMRNMRPTQKQRTGAERFEIEHHGEYEARAQQSRNKVSRVLTHNNACPKLYDELDKRRSTAKPTASSAHRRQSRVCSTRRQLKSKPQKDKNRRNVPRKFTKHRRNTPGICKPRRRIRQKQRTGANLTFSKLNIHRGCQCSNQQTLLEKCVSTNNISFKTGNHFGRQSESMKREFQALNKQKSLRVVSMASIKEDPKSESQIQEASLPSVTSYNSYLSMDHEPMVD